jgi:hypothetical protein
MSVVAKDQTVILELRSFCIHNIAILAAIILNLPLLHFVELIKSRRKSVAQFLYIAIRVERPPRLDARSTFARL